MTSILVTAGLLKFSCISIQEHIQSHREQFWGRAALAPVILSGSGRFYILAKARIGFRRLECSTNLLRLAGQFWGTFRRFLRGARAALRRTGRDFPCRCDFPYPGASNPIAAFL